MNTTLKTASIIYSVILMISMVFLFNNFTTSAEINFVFRIISICLMCYLATFPLLIATSKQSNISTISKVILYFVYICISAGVLFFAFKTFGDKNFMFNINLTDEAFVNSQENLTSMLWIFLLACMIVAIVIFSLKMWKDWSDWTYALLIPSLPLITIAIVFALAIVLVISGLMIVYYFLKGLGEATNSSTSTTHEIEVEEEEEEEEEEQRRNGVLRSPGENYYDGNGILRSPGENYYDANGILRSPGENYYDYNGVLRSPGENYYDSNGVLRSPDENYYDGGY